MRLCPLLLTLALGCSSSEDDAVLCAATQPVASEIQRAILSPSCALSASCHSRSGRKATLDLSSVAASCRDLKNQPSCEFPSKVRARAGEPAERSFLIEKLTCAGPVCEGTPQCAGESTNERMPASSSRPLADCKIDLIRRWIESGMEGCP